MMEHHRLDHVAPASGCQSDVTSTSPVSLGEAIALAGGEAIAPAGAEEDEVPMEAPLWRR